VGDVVPYAAKKNWQSKRADFARKNGSDPMNGFQKDAFALMELAIEPNLTCTAADLILDDAVQVPEESSSSFRRISAKHIWTLTSAHQMPLEEIIKLSSTAATGLVRQLENPTEPNNAPVADAFLDDLMAPATPAKRPAPASTATNKAKAARTVRATANGN